MAHAHGQVVAGAANGQPESVRGSGQFLQDWPTPTHRLGLAIRRAGDDLPVRMRHVVP